MSGEERISDSARSNEDDDMIPSSQNSERNLLSFHNEFQVLGRRQFSLKGDSSKGLPEDIFIPFSRPTFEDGFCDIGPSQNIDLQLTDSHLPEESSQVAQEESTDPESPIKIYVRETSTESQGSGAVPRNGGKADANVGNPPVEDDEETELNADNEQTLTPCRTNVTHSVEPSVDLDGSCSSEDITAVSIIASMHLESAKKRLLEETSCDTEVDAKKRARTQEPLSPERSDSVVVASSAAPSPTAPKIPSPAASSIHTSPNVPHVAELPTYFVDFSVNVYNSSAEQKPFQRSIIVPSSDLSIQRFQVTCDQLITALCQFFAANGVSVSRQSSLSTTTPSDSDLLGYLADTSSSSGGGGGVTAATSFLSVVSRRSSTSFHAPHPHDILRPSGSAPPDLRPANLLTSDPLRRSDVAAYSFPPGHRHLVRRQSSDLLFKVPGAPMGRRRSIFYERHGGGRHSGSSSSSGPDADISMEASHAEVRVSFAPSCASSESDSVPPPVRSRPPGESGYMSSSDIFDEPRPLAKIQEEPAEGRVNRDSSSSSSSSLREANRRVEQDPFESIRASRAKVTQPSSTGGTTGPGGSKDVDPDTNTVYRVDAPDVMVYARWKNERFLYAGSVIGTKLSKDKLKVLFDDSSEADVRTHDILFLELLPEGTIVLADNSGTGVYERGFRILHHLERVSSSSDSSASAPTTRRNFRGYIVRHLESNQELSLPRGSVAIGLEEAQSLLLVHRAPGTPVADLSLDNIVHTKRQPKEKRLRASWVSTPPPLDRLRRSSQTSSPRNGRSPRSAGHGSPSRGGRRRAGGTPGAKETSGHEGSAATVQLSSETSTTDMSDVSGCGESMLGASSGETVSNSPWPTQKFQPTGSSLSGETQIGSLFASFTFLITGGDAAVSNGRTDSPSKRQSHPLRPAFNRDVLRSRIEDNGGRIVDVVTEELLSDEGRMILIASETNRTAKFLQCLAAAVPCLRFTWVLDSLAEGVLQPLKAYRLPRGVDLLTNEEVPWKENMEGGAGSDIFSGAAIAILTDDAGIFGEVWDRILSLAGAVAQVLPLSAARSARLGRFRAVLLDEKRCSAFTLHQIEAQRSCPPIVSHHFFIQGLLHARMLDPLCDGPDFRPQLRDT